MAIERATTNITKFLQMSIKKRGFASFDELDAVPNVSLSHPLSCPHFFYLSIYIHQLGLARPEFFLLGDGAIAFGDSLALLPWHVRETSVPRYTQSH